MGWYHKGVINDRTGRKSEVRRVGRARGVRAGTRRLGRAGLASRLRGAQHRAAAPRRPRRSPRDARRRRRRRREPHCLPRLQAARCAHATRSSPIDTRLISLKKTFIRPSLITTHFP